MNEFKFENPYEIELRVKMDAETHKQLVQFCAERHTTRAEVVRQLIDELLKRKQGIQVSAPVGRYFHAMEATFARKR